MRSGGSAWLGHQLGKLGVAGSNPARTSPQNSIEAGGVFLQFFSDRVDS